MQENNKKLLMELISAILTVGTAGLIVLGGIFLIKILFKTSETLTPPSSATSTVIIPAVDTNEIDPGKGYVSSTSSTATSDWNLFNSHNYKKTNVYPGGIETPQDYISNATQALSNAGRMITVTGTVEDAYIYIKAGTNDNKGIFTSINPQFDGIWFYTKNGFFKGGILDLSQSRRGEATQYTELLYNLKTVPLALNNEEYRKGNFVSNNLLNELKDGNFVAALVSTSRYGKLIEFKIGYKCAPETPKCLIVVQN